MEGSLVFLFAALIITWLLIVGYMLLLGGRLHALQRELRSVKSVGERDRGSETAPRVRRQKLVLMRRKDGRYEQMRKGRHI